MQQARKPYRSRAAAIRQQRRFHHLERAISRVESAVCAAPVPPAPAEPAWLDALSMDTPVLPVPIEAIPAEVIEEEPDLAEAIEQHEWERIPFLMHTPEPEPPPVAAEEPAVIVAEEPAPVAAAATLQPEPEWQAAPSPVIVLEETISEAPELPAAVSHPIFLSEEEFIAPAPPSPVPAPKPKKRMSEVELATTWLPRIGGVLLLIGAAIAGTLITPRLGPEMKVLLGYMVAGAVAAGGFFVQKHQAMLGRITMAIAAALAYFISFATFYLQPTQVFSSSIPSLDLMFLCAGAIVMMAERWRSEAVATMAFLLGVVATLISAGTSEGFALVALGMLCCGGGFVLVRHEWKNLTAISLAGTYLATLALWFLHPIGSAGEVQANLGALLFYHLMFTAAFWRWGRKWVAREEAVAEAQAHDAIPLFHMGTLPYSTAMAILNSLALISLSLFLVWRTEFYWNEVEWILFGLCAIEAARLCMKPLRRGSLGSFHGLTAFSLLSAGLVAAFDGPMESTMLAAQALILTIGATRARQLRFLRPLTVIPAGLAMKDLGYGAATVVDLVSAVMPGLLLLATALPWEAVWVRHPKRFASGWMRVAELISSQVRALMATAAVATVLFSTPLLNSTPRLFAVSAALSLLLVAGAVILRAKRWLLPGCLMMLLTLTLASARSPESWAYHLFLGMPWLYAVIILWKNMREDAEAKLEKGLVVILGGLLALATVPLFVAAARFMEPAQGLVLAVCATGAYLSWKLAFLLPPLPRLVRAFEETEEGILAKLRIPDLARSWTEMGVIAAMVGGAIAAGFILFADAPQSLLSLAVVGGAVFIRWIMLASGKGERAVLARRALFVLLQMVSCAAILIHGEADLTSIMWAVALEVALATVALMRAGRVEFGSAVVLLSALPLVTIPAIGLGGAAIPLQAYAAMAIAPLLIVAHRLIAWTRKHWEVESLAFQTPPVVFQGWFTVVAAILSLVVLSRGAVVPESLITVSWGVVGAVLLTLGFLFLDRVMRYASFGVFGLAIARIFLHELAGAPPLTKAIAFLGVGLLLVCAALAYGFLRTRVAGKEAEHAAEDHAQQG